ncbi:MAG TPA: DUF488 domain-containing protein [Gemmatimonadaceae bacterium]|jgi:uncharacterized protein (DUF488 family)
MKKIATIGYEGATVAGFLDALKTHGVDLLIDVRALASSRRPGFAKTALSANLAEAGIEYLHVRELGTPADGRAEARAGHHDEMRRIFLAHLAKPDAQAGLDRVVDLVQSGRHIALMCLEADPAHCHRRLVAEALVARTPLKVTDLAVADAWDSE